MKDDIESRKAAARRELDSLLASGHVQRVLLFPSIFGGTDDPRNVSWLPPACIQEKEQFELQVRQAMERSGEPVEYTATPIYSGDSMAPVEIRLTASNATVKFGHVIDARPHLNG
jgi:hypothetical protein